MEISDKITQIKTRLLMMVARPTGNQILIPSNRKLNFASNSKHLKCLYCKIGMAVKLLIQNSFHHKDRTRTPNLDIAHPLPDICYYEPF